MGHRLHIFEKAGTHKVSGGQLKPCAPHAGLVYALLAIELDVNVAVRPRDLVSARLLRRCANIVHVRSFDMVTLYRI